MWDSWEASERGQTVDGGWVGAQAQAVEAPAPPRKQPAVANDQDDDWQGPAAFRRLVALVRSEQHVAAPRTVAPAGHLSRRTQTASADELDRVDPNDEHGQDDDDGNDDRDEDNAQLDDDGGGGDDDDVLNAERNAGARARARAQGYTFPARGLPRLP